jgi:hypothetical protein
MSLETGKITTNTSRRERRHNLPPGLQDINLETGKITTNTSRRERRHNVPPGLQDINLETGKITANTSRRERRHKLPPGLQDINLETGKITAITNRRGPRHNLLPGLQDINLETGKIIANTKRGGRSHKLSTGLQDIWKPVHEDGNNNVNVNENATCNWGAEQTFIPRINNKDLLNYTHQPPIPETTKDFWDSFDQIRSANISGNLINDRTSCTTALLFLEGVF